MAEPIDLPLAAIRQELVDQDINFGLVNLDPDTNRIGCVWGLTYLSCAPETPHILLS